MAYVSQEDKKELAVGIKKVLAKYNMKGTIGVHNHSTIVVNLRSGELDILGNYWDNYKENEYKIDPWNKRSEPPNCLQVNEHYIERGYTGKVAEFLLELKSAMRGERYFDNSDIMTDYFHVSHYTDINVGKWDKPYVFNGELATAA